MAYFSSEERPLSGGDFSLEVIVGELGRDSASSRARQEALLNQIGLVDVFEGSTRFAQRGAEGFDPHRPSPVVIDEDRQKASIHFIEARLVHIEPFERLSGGLAVELPVAQDLREVAGAAQQVVGDAWGAARSSREFKRGFFGDVHLQKGGAPGHDRAEFVGLVVVEPGRITEA